MLVAAAAVARGSLHVRFLSIRAVRVCVESALFGDELALAGSLPGEDEVNNFLTRHGGCTAWSCVHCREYPALIEDFVDHYLALNISFRDVKFHGCLFFILSRARQSDVFNIVHCI